MQNLRGKKLWNKMKFKLIRKRETKRTNGQGGMNIQLRAAIFEINRTIQALQTVFICLLSLSFVCFFHLWFKRYRSHVVYNDVTHNSVTCSLTLRHVTESRYVCTFSARIFFIHWDLNKCFNRRNCRKTNEHRKLNYSVTAEISKVKR